MSYFEARCAECDGTEITMMAICEWDGERQEWVADEFLSNPFYCRDCDSTDWKYVEVEEGE